MHAFSWLFLWKKLIVHRYQLMAALHTGGRNHFPIKSIRGTLFLNTVKPAPDI